MQKEKYIVTKCSLFGEKKKCLFEKWFWLPGNTGLKENLLILKIASFNSISLCVHQTYVSIFILSANIWVPSMFCFWLGASALVFQCR